MRPDRPVSSAASASLDAASSSSSSQPKPVSARKLAANRANAARSTGPRTDAGKANSSRNAITHGLTALSVCVFPEEDEVELTQFAEAMYADLQPRGAAQREIIGRIVSLSWRLRRAARAEEELAVAADEREVAAWEKKCRQMVQTTDVLHPFWSSEEADEPPPATGEQFVGRQFASNSGTSPLERLAVYEQRLDRQVQAAYRQFYQLRKMQREQEDAGEDGNDAAPDVPECAIERDEVRGKNEPTEPGNSPDKPGAQRSGDPDVLRDVAHLDPGGASTPGVRAERCAAPHPGTDARDVRRQNEPTADPCESGSEEAISGSPSRRRS